MQPCSKGAVDCPRATVWNTPHTQNSVAPHLQRHSPAQSVRTQGTHLVPWLMNREARGERVGCTRQRRS